MNSKYFINKIIGNYKLKNLIGEGSYSSVYIAEEINQKSNISKNSKMNIDESKSIKKNYVACKIVPRSKNENKKFTSRLDKEIKIHRMMHHPNVVQLIDIQKDSDFYYIFLEFCKSGELLNLISSYRKISEIEAAIIFKQILIGLQYIHSMNVAHRDLKPENILVDQFGQIKISDFGFSKLLNINHQNLTKTPCGTAFYVSPECISGLPYDGKKSDIWSCGVILYAIVTGFLPWSKINQMQLFEQIRKGDFKVPFTISYNCSDLIHRLLTVDYNKRITIEEALQHPFLKNVSCPCSEQTRKFVSLRKIDKLLGFDEDFEYGNMFSTISQETSESDSNFENSFFKVRKSISKNETYKESKTNYFQKSIRICLN